METSLTAALQAIVDGSRLKHLGCFLRRQKIQIKGTEQIDEGMQFIDEKWPEGRDVLIPLLEHEDRGVRAVVASALLVSRPELCLPVLEDIRVNCPTIAQQSAIVILASYDTFGPGVMSMCRPDPRFPIPEKYRYDGPPFVPET